MATTITRPSFQIKGQSGRVYTFYVYPIGTSFESAAGVYLFTKLNEGVHKHIYLGITSDLSVRFDGHHKAACIAKNGANQICAFLMTDENDRKAAEKDLLSVISTTCNEVMN